MEAGSAGNGRNHHAGEELHGSYVALIEGAGRGRQHFENAQSAAVVTQRRHQNRADSETATTGQIHARVTLGVMTQHNFAGAHRLRRDASIGLQTNSQVRSSSSGTGTTDNFVPGPQSDGGSGGTG